MHPPHSRSSFIARSVFSSLSQPPFCVPRPLFVLSHLLHTDPSILAFFSICFTCFIELFNISFILSPQLSGDLFPRSRIFQPPGINPKIYGQCSLVRSLRMEKRSYRGRRISLLIDLANYTCLRYAMKFWWDRDLGRTVIKTRDALSLVNERNGNSNMEI